MSDYFK